MKANIKSDERLPLSIDVPVQPVLSISDRSSLFFLSDRGGEGRDQEGQGEKRRKSIAVMSR